MKKIFCILAAVCLSICAATAASAADLTVSAAASLKEAFNAVKADFEKLHPETVVRLSFAGSNTCLRQIREGAPADIFASADQETMDKADAEGLTYPETRTDFARNDLVLIAPADTALQKADFADAVKALEAPGVNRIAVGKPESVPAGRYTRDALIARGKWEALQPKCIFGQDVRQTLAYAAQGEVDAAFVYRTDALKGKDDVCILSVAAGHKPILYPIVVCKTGKNNTAARQFIEFVTGRDGQNILATYGFSRP